MNPPGDDSSNQSIHDIVRRQTDAAVASIRADIENLERLYASQHEKTSDNAYEVRRAREILDALKADVGKLEVAIDKLANSIADLPLIRKIVYYTSGMILAGFLAWLLVKSGWSNKS